MPGGKRNFAVSSLLDLIYPRLCGSCGRPLLWRKPFALCPECIETLVQIDEERCPRCGLAGGRYAGVIGSCLYCRGRRLYFDEAISAGSYDGGLRQIILRYKYGGQRHLARALAELLNARLEKEILSLRADGILWVPLHFLRKMERGFDQSELVASFLSREMGLPLLKGVLVRGRYGPAQVGLPARERIRGPRGAFKARDSAKIRGKRLILVDDVLTTGSTASECSRILKRAGAAWVMAAVVARTDADHIELD